MDLAQGNTMHRLARVAGALYLLNIVFGAFAIGVVPAMLFVSGDPAATAHNIEAHALLYRLGIAAHVVVVMTNVGLVVIFYDLFRVVNRRVTLVMVVAAMIATAVEASYLVNQFTPLALLGGAPYSGTLTPAQLQAASYLTVDQQGLSYDVSGVFFGIDVLVTGYLVFKSTFLPRAIGVLLAIDGAAYLTYGFADFIAPGFAAHLVPWFQLPTLAGEGSLCVWLLAFGVSAAKWNRVAGLGRSSAVGTGQLQRGMSEFRSVRRRVCRSPCDLFDRREVAGQGDRKAVPPLQESRAVVRNPGRAGGVLPDQDLQRQVDGRAWRRDHDRRPGLGAAEDQQLGRAHRKSDPFGLAAVVDQREKCESLVAQDRLETLHGVLD